MPDTGSWGPDIPTVLTLKDAGVELGGRALVRDVTLRLEAGETLAILGPNGAGKTVLLRALMGLTPHTGVMQWAAEARLGYVPQRPEADRNLPLSCLNLLEAKAAVLGLKRAGLEELSEAVGLDPETLAAPVGHLSGGQFQRALLAFALLGDPNVLLLDEPTAGVDQPGEERLYDLLHRMQAKRALTMVLVSHDLSHVYAYADRVLCLNRAAVCLGPPREVLTPAALEALFGGPARFYHTDHDHPARAPHD